jgi:hypothetical protein
MADRVLDQWLQYEGWNAERVNAGLALELPAQPRAEPRRSTSR